MTSAVSPALPSTCDHHAHFSQSNHRKISPSLCFSSFWTTRVVVRWQWDLKCQKVPFSICLFHGTPHQAMTCGNVSTKGRPVHPIKGRFKINTDPFISSCEIWGRQLQVSSSPWLLVAFTLKISFKTYYYEMYSSLAPYSTINKSRVNSNFNLILLFNQLPYSVL